MEQNKIEVVRYVRPRRDETVQTNLYGITVVNEIDYESRTVKAGFSVCEGDNFSKQLGYDIAKQRLLDGKAFNFNFNMIDHFGGLTHTLRDEIALHLGMDLMPSQYRFYFPWDFSDDLFLFKEGLRFLNEGAK